MNCSWICAFTHGANVNIPSLGSSHGMARANYEISTESVLLSPHFCIRGPHIRPRAAPPSSGSGFTARSSHDVLASCSVEVRCHVSIATVFPLRACPFACEVQVQTHAHAQPWEPRLQSCSCTPAQCFSSCGRHGLCPALCKRAGVFRKHAGDCKCVKSSACRGSVTFAFTMTSFMGWTMGASRCESCATLMGLLLSYLLRSNRNNCNLSGQALASLVAIKRVPMFTPSAPLHGLVSGLCVYQSLSC